MATKKAHLLAKERDLGNTAEDFYKHIVNSMQNGQRQQVRNLFNRMKKHNKFDFLVNFIDVSVGIEKSTLNVCIEELTI
jgi:hypothetical protein